MQEREYADIALKTVEEIRRDIGDLTVGDIGDWVSREVIDSDIYTDELWKDYVGCRLYVTMGGPTIYIDTHNDSVVYTNNGFKAEVMCGEREYDAFRELDSYMSECFSSNPDMFTTIEVYEP